MAATKDALKLVERNLTWLQLITGGGALTAVGYVSKLVAEKTTWITSNGPYAIWLAVLVSVLIAAAVLGLIGWFRYALAHANAIDHWKTKVADTVDPMAPEFHNLRIRLGDLVSPATSDIRNKKFSRCELIGPMNIFGTGRLSHTAFVNTNVIMIPKDQYAFVTNLIDCTIDDCFIVDCNIFLTEDAMADFKRYNTGIPVVGDASTPWASHPAARPKRPAPLDPGSK